MNTLLKKHLWILTLLVVGFVISASAQHDRHDGGSRGGSNQSRGSYNRDSYSRQSGPSFDRLENRQSSFNRSAPFRDNRQSVIVNRDRFSQYPSYRQNRNSSFDQRSNRGAIVYNNTRVNNSYRYNSGYGYQRGYSSYRYYEPRRYIYAGAPRYSILPRGYLTIRFGGYPYYYNSGLFFSYYNGFYEPVFAPIGIHVRVLPYGYYPVYIGPSLYYYYNGVYYRGYNNNDYEVVDAPMGAQVYVLPKGAKVAMVNGEKFYEFNGTYYKEGTNSKNEVVYTVVGKYGEINNTDDQPATSSSQQLRMGDVVTNLPENSRQVTINGEVLYVSSDHTYFKPQINGNTTSYQVVGVETDNQ